MNCASTELTIILVLFEENKELVFKCLKNIQNFRVIIIDNADNINLKKKVENIFKIEKYVLNKKNIGFSKAANQAIKLCKTDYILNINADCFIEEKEILKLIKLHKSYKNCFLITPTFYDDDSNLSYNGDCFEEKNFTKEALNLNGDVCVDKVLGSAILFKKKDIQDMQYLDENFFLYYVDDDLCHKAKKIGKSIVQTFDVKAKHVHGQIKVKNVLKQTFIRNYHFTFDQLYYYYKINKKDKKYPYLKKKIKNYLIKMIINLIIFNLNKSIYYFSLIKAFYDFNKLMNFTPKTKLK